MMGYIRDGICGRGEKSSSRKKLQTSGHLPRSGFGLSHVKELSMLVLSHPGFTLGVFLLKAQKAILALQRPLWGEQGSNPSELNMCGEVVTHVYNVPEFKNESSRSP